MVNNDLNSTQSVTETSTPQATDSAPAGSDSSQFQKSADASALNQSQEVTVQNNGQPIDASSISKTASSGSGGLIWLLLAVALVCLVLLGRRSKQSARVEHTAAAAKAASRPAKTNTAKAKTKSASKTKKSSAKSKRKR